MSNRCLLLAFGGLLCLAGLGCPPLWAQDMMGDGQRLAYPSGFGAGLPDGPANPVPTGRAPKPILLGHAHAGPSAPTFPYGYFGAESHYRWNSHFTTSEEYMFWRPGWRRY